MGKSRSRAALGVSTRASNEGVEVKMREVQLVKNSIVYISLERLTILSSSQAHGTRDDKHPHDHDVQSYPE